MRRSKPLKRFVFFCMIPISLKRGVNETIRRICNSNPWTRESLDTEGIAFRMCSLWEAAIEREKIAKLNGSSWSNGYLITSSDRGTSLSSKVIWRQNPQGEIRF